MLPATSADDYEKSFLERYFKSQAAKKIAALEQKISEPKNTAKAAEYKRQIGQIRKELENDLRLIHGTESVAKENMEKKQESMVVGDRDDLVVHAGIGIPRYLWDYMFAYQQEGVRWMIDLYVRAKGGILADEMGLGKTIQAVAFMAGLFIRNSAERVLILCPATMIYHWRTEINRISLDIKTSSRIEAGGGAFIMSYENYKSTGRGEAFDMVVLDEGHKIKNKDAQITQAVKQIRCKSRFILTGTPIQNNLAELWSLFDFIAPGLLGTHVIFQKEFEEPIGNKQNHEESYHYSVMLRSIIEPHILRRTKAQVSHKLPGRTDKVVFVSLTGVQHNLYVRALESSKFRRALTERKGLFAAIDHLRKICNHPFLVDEKMRMQYNGGAKYDEYEEDPSSSTESGLDDAAIEEPEKATRQGSIIDASGKMIAMMALLRKWHEEGNKALVFSQTVQMQNILAAAMEAESFRYLRLSGAVPVERRAALVEEFNGSQGVFVLLLTTRVGGLGLNLTGANRIILYDPDWNPSTDNQAKERIYRYGQRTAVEIYRIICRNTLEERIYQKQIYKDCLSKKILNDPGVRMVKDAVFELFSYSASTHESPTVVDCRSSRAEEDAGEDELVEVREEDKREFLMMKELSAKSVLTGPELIEYITRREMQLE